MTTASEKKDYEENLDPEKATAASEPLNQNLEPNPLNHLSEKSAVGHRLRAATRKEAGQYELAIADYIQAIELEPDNGNNYFFLGLCHALIGNKEEALSAFNMAAFVYQKQNSKQATIAYRWVEQIASGKYKVGL